LNTYIGTKRIKGLPMNRADYNIYRGWELPADENGADEGYLVEYLDSPTANHPKHEGYISWSPKKEFLDAYRCSGEMDFGMALYLLKKGKKLSRTGWNGKGMFIFLVPGSIFKVNRAPLLGIYPEGTQISYHSHIDMKTADNMVVPWLCSQTDMLADDWGIVDV